MALLVRRHRGRLADFTGDNFLAEFPSTLDAVQAAVEIQRVLGAAGSGSTSRLGPGDPLDYAAVADP